MTHTEIVLVLCLLPLLLAQGLYLFVDARRRECYPWLWGMWGLTSIPLPLLVYLIAVHKIHRKWRRS